MTVFAHINSPGVNSLIGIGPWGEVMPRVFNLRRQGVEVRWTSNWRESFAHRSHPAIARHVNAYLGARKENA